MWAIQEKPNTSGKCSPIITGSDFAEGLVIQCEGLNPDVEKTLNSLLNQLKKVVEIQQASLASNSTHEVKQLLSIMQAIKLQEAEKWSKKYHELEVRLAKFEDKLAHQIQQSFKQGDLDNTGQLLDQIISREVQHVDSEELANVHYLRSKVYDLQYQPFERLKHLKKVTSLRPDNMDYAYEYRKLLEQKKSEVAANKFSPPAEKNGLVGTVTGKDSQTDVASSLVGIGNAVSLPSVNDTSSDNRCNIYVPSTTVEVGKSLTAEALCLDKSVPSFYAWYINGVKQQYCNTSECRIEFASIGNYELKLQVASNGKPLGSEVVVYINVVDDSSLMSTPPIWCKAKIIEVLAEGETVTAIAETNPGIVGNIESYHWRVETREGFYMQYSGSIVKLTFPKKMSNSEALLILEVGNEFGCRDKDVQPRVLR